jgi:hypothetical protein
MIIRNIDYVSKFLRTNLKRGGGEAAPPPSITYPINSVRSPFSNSDFVYWLERGKNFANNNSIGQVLLTASGNGQSPDMRFDNSFATLNSANTFHFTQNRAISLWLYLIGTSNPYHGVICKDSIGSGTREWNLTYINDASPLQGKIGWAVWSAGGSIICQLSANLTLNTWQHWLLNYDHASTTFTLYRNGGLQDTQSISGSYNSNSGVATFLGGFTNASNFMNGYLNQVILANRKFTTDEIALLYNSGSGYFTI